MSACGIQGVDESEMFLFVYFPFQMIHPLDLFLDGY